jgi:RNA polymerase sigma-70 factor (ECF subfamily)
MNEMGNLCVIAREREKEGSAVVVDEQGLIRKAARGDSRALSELLQQQYSFLYQYALKLTMNKSYAEDVTQETMLRAIEKISAFQGKAKFSTWLITIASRIYVDRIRSKERERKWVQEEQTLRAIRYETQTLLGDWPEALDAIGRMPGDIRMAVLLKYYYGYAQEEIASMLEVPVGTVKSRLHNGLKQLRKELGEDGQS